MSDFTPQMAPPGRKPTPGTVKYAAYLQWLVLLLTLVGLVFALLYAGKQMDAAIAELKAQDSPQKYIDAYESSKSFAAIGPIITLVIAAVYALLGVFNQRGSNGSRITTWILSGLFLLCGGGLFLLGQVGGGGTQDGVDYDKVADAMSDAVPSWYGLWGTVSALLQILAVVGVIVMLALPASNEFFRKAPPQLILPGDEIK